MGHFEDKKPGLSSLKFEKVLKKGPQAGDTINHKSWRDTEVCDIYVTQNYFVIRSGECV